MERTLGRGRIPRERATPPATTRTQGQIPLTQIIRPQNIKYRSEDVFKMSKPCL